jgi:hypothetical protein
MQAFSNDPPFPRGAYQNFYTTTPATAAAEQPFYGVLGCEWDFPDMLWDTGNNAPPTIRSSTPVRCRLVKNNTGSAILPKKACKIDPADAGSITALTSATTDQYGLADEFLPAAGVPDKGVFWMVVRGNAKCIAAASLIANWTAGQYLVASGVTSGALDMFDFTAVPTTATPFTTMWTALKNARARATAANSTGGATVTVQMTE